jgi:6-phosphogluconate dehydrogenase
MELGMIGLGKMGGNMTRRLVRGGHRVVVYDREAAVVEGLVGEGAEGAGSVEELVGRRGAPRAVWLMVPAGAVVDAVIGELRPHLEAGDTVVDGGNSRYKDTMARGERLAADGIELVDCGTSGGVWGLEGGYSLMVGGGVAAVERLRPVLECLAPAADRGWGHVGPTGAGHFVKMVHNGIEYGLMQAYAEGFALLKRKRDFDLDLAQVAEIWRHGSVVRSWLLDLVAGVLAEDASLAEVAPWVPDSGEGRWTVEEAIELASPAPVITLALMQRFRSRDAESYPDRLLAALRNAFGGHAMREAADGEAPAVGSPQPPVRRGGG